MSLDTGVPPIYCEIKLIRSSIVRAWIVRDFSFVILICCVVFVAGYDFQ